MPCKELTSPCLSMLNFRPPTHSLACPQIFFFFFFVRKISPELTSANPPLFAEEDWPWANIRAHLPLLYVWDAYHSIA